MTQQQTSTVEVSRPVAVTLETAYHQIHASQTVKEYVTKRDSLSKELRQGDRQQFNRYIAQHHRHLLLAKKASPLDSDLADTASSKKTTRVRFDLKRMHEVDRDHKDYPSRKRAFKRRFEALSELKKHGKNNNYSKILNFDAHTISHIRFDDETLEHRIKEELTFRDSLKTNDGEPLVQKIINEMLELIRQTNTNPSV